MKKLAKAIGGAVAAVALLAGCSGGTTGTDTAAEFPKKGSTIEWIVPSAAGAANDILARIMAPAMQETLGANVKVINKEGGSQIVGLNYAANAKPDGHTIVYTNIPSILGRYLDPEQEGRLRSRKLRADRILRLQRHRDRGEQEQSLQDHQGPLHRGAGQPRNHHRRNRLARR